MSKHKRSRALTPHRPTDLWGRRKSAIRTIVKSQHNTRLAAETIDSKRKQQWESTDKRVINQVTKILQSTNGERGGGEARRLGELTFSGA